MTRTDRKELVRALYLVERSFREKMDLVVCKNFYLKPPMGKLVCMICAVNAQLPHETDREEIPCTYKDAVRIPAIPQPQLMPHAP